MKPWVVKLSIHLNYWLIMVGLTYGIYWQRLHIDSDHEAIRQLMERLGF